jgi:hypothetical protein
MYEEQNAKAVTKNKVSEKTYFVFYANKQEQLKERKERSWGINQLVFLEGRFNAKRSQRS